MTVVEIKSNLHKLIDKIQDEQLLSTVHDFLKSREAIEPGKLWETLTQEEKEELLVSLEESEEDKNLLPHEQVMKNYEKWL